MFVIFFYLYLTPVSGTTTQPAATCKLSKTFKPFYPHFTTHSFLCRKISPSFHQIVDTETKKKSSYNPVFNFSFCFSPCLVSPSWVLTEFSVLILFFSPCRVLDITYLNYLFVIRYNIYPNTLCFLFFHYKVSLLSNNEKKAYFHLLLKADNDAGVQ